MVDAHQCDRCGEFGTGAPNRYKVREHHSLTMLGWGDGETLHKIELCDNCAESFESTVSEWLDGPQGRGRDDE